MSADKVYMWFPLIVLLSSAIVLIGPYVAWMIRRDRARKEAWRSWAAANDFEFVPREGPLRARTGDHVRGRRGAIEFELHMARAATGNRGIVYTRLVATGERLVSARLEVRARSWIQRLNRHLLADWVEIDDARFGERWLARGERRDEVVALLNDDLRQALIESRGIEIVRITEGSVEVLLRGEPADPAILDRALDVACAAWPRTRAPLRRAS